MNENYPRPPSFPAVSFTADLTRRDLHRRSDLIRAARGVYLVRPPSQQPSWKTMSDMTLARCLMLARHYGKDGVLTHEAAAIALGLWGVRYEPDIRMSVAASRTQGSRLLPKARRVSASKRPTVRLITTRRNIPDDQIVLVHGMRVTSPLLTAVDCACVLPVRDSLPVIDSALRAVTIPDRASDLTRGLLTTAQARDELRRLSSSLRGHRGIRRARSAIELGDARAESPGESVLRWAVFAVGGPTPILQYEARTPQKRYFLDLAFPEHHVAWEFDGLTKFSTQEDLRGEKERELRLNGEGWHVERFGWDEVRNAPHLLTRVRDFWGRRDALTAPPLDLVNL